MKKIEFEDGKLVEQGYVIVGKEKYNVEEAKYSGTTPLSAFLLNQLQNNIEEAINDIKSNISNKLDIYPIGSIIFNATGINPSQYLGGSWIAWGSGRVPVGVNEDEVEFDIAEKTGGEKEHTLTISEMPNHTHTFTGDSHTHTYSKSSTTSGSTTLTVSQIPSHSHQLRYSGTNNGGYLVKNNQAGSLQNGENTGSCLGNGTFQDRETGTFRDFPALHSTGGGSSHNHSITLSNATSGEKVVTGSNSNIGGGVGHNNLQPYVTCYMWKRTA